MFTYNDIRDLIDNYAWMLNEVKRMRRELDNGESVKFGVAQLDLTGASKSNRKTDRVFVDVTLRERQFKRLEKLEEKLNFVETLLNNADLTDKEWTFIDLLLSGESISKAIKIFNLTRSSGSRLLNSIVNRMLKASVEQGS